MKDPGAGVRWHHQTGAVVVCITMASVLVIAARLVDDLMRLADADQRFDISAPWAVIIAVPVALLASTVAIGVRTWKPESWRDLKKWVIWLGLTAAVGWATQRALGNAAASLLLISAAIVIGVDAWTLGTWRGLVTLVPRLGLVAGVCWCTLQALGDCLGVELASSPGEIVGLHWGEAAYGWPNLWADLIQLPLHAGAVVLLIVALAPTGQADQPDQPG